MADHVVVKSIFLEGNEVLATRVDVELSCDADQLYGVVYNLVLKVQSML